MRNFHKDIAEEEVNNSLTDYMKKLQNSGYDEKFRREVLIAGKNGYKKQLEADKKGERPLYRP